MGAAAGKVFSSWGLPSSPKSVLMPDWWTKANSASVAEWVSAERAGSEASGTVKGTVASGASSVFEGGEISAESAMVSTGADWRWTRSIMCEESGIVPGDSGELSGHSATVVPSSDCREPESMVPSRDIDSMIFQRFRHNRTCSTNSVSSIP